MKRWTTAALIGAWIVTGHSTFAETRADQPGLCIGGYSDDFAALSAQTREFDHHPEAVFSYCTRNTAVYECLSYGTDGAVKRLRKKVVLHGTAFGFKRQGGDSLLLTNDHVASWPLVTDPQHPVEDVPMGCKKVAETLALVDDEHDKYARDDIPVTRLATDAELDVAILKAHADLHIMPWKIGHSNALRERNLVEVRGFPLGAFRATNLGKVISTYDHDDYGDWDHDDFVVDALLSAGNSGSPVLAISCATGEYELVGIYHAGYTAGSALNIVVGIDQVRDFMATLKREPRDRENSRPAVDAVARTSVQAALGPDNQVFFPMGGQVAQVKGSSAGRLLFSVFPRDFPTTSEPALVIEDVPPPHGGSFGDLGRVWFGSSRGLKVYDPPSLPADASASIADLLDALRGDVTGYLAYRAARSQEAGSRQSDDRARRLGARLARTIASRADLLQAIGELADRLGPPAGASGITFASLLQAEAAPREPVLSCSAQSPGTAVLVAAAPRSSAPPAAISPPPGTPARDTPPAPAGPEHRQGGRQ